MNKKTQKTTTRTRKTTSKIKKKAATSRTSAAAQVAEDMPERTMRLGLAALLFVNGIMAFVEPGRVP